MIIFGLKLFCFADGTEYQLEYKKPVFSKYQTRFLVAGFWLIRGCAHYWLCCPYLSLIQYHSCSLGLRKGNFFEYRSEVIISIFIIGSEFREYHFNNGRHPGHMQPLRLRRHGDTRWKPLICKKNFAKCWWIISILILNGTLMQPHTEIKYLYPL